MAYTPPAGDQATLDIASSGYTPDAGNAVNLNIGWTYGSNRTLTVSARTRAPRASAGWISGRVLTGTARTRTPTVRARVVHIVLATVGARTRSPVAASEWGYDPNLLSAVHLKLGSNWEQAELLPTGQAFDFGPAERFSTEPAIRWNPADFQPQVVREGWQPADRLSGDPASVWQDGTRQSATRTTFWQTAERLMRDPGSRWQDGIRQSVSTFTRWQSGLLIWNSPNTRWQDGIRQSRTITSRFHDGARRTLYFVERWQPGGYPSNARRTGPPVPPPIVISWTSDLNICRNLPGTNLNIGQIKCPVSGLVDLPVRRTYVSVSSASITLLPDRIPLPCTQLTVQTDADSWCWGLSATLVGSTAFTLVQPVPGSPKTVEVIINGHTWQFVLDYPNRARKFNSTSVTVQGRSLSALLDLPYTDSSDGVWQDDATMQQLAEAALDNTGWTLNWTAPDWFVPGGLFSWSSVALMGRICQLAKAFDGCVYTYPTTRVITVYDRYPVPSWLWDAIDPVDVILPDDAILETDRSVLLMPYYNGVYVSGTTTGVLALVKVAGTDGMSQPGEPLSGVLLCDSDGLAARTRGRAFLSQSGEGYLLKLKTIMSGDGPDLIVPGQSLRVENQTGMVRRVEIAAQQSGGMLIVSQTVTGEFWQVE